MLVRGEPAQLVDPGSLPIVVCHVFDPDPRETSWSSKQPLDGGNADLAVSEADVNLLTQRVLHAPLAARTLAVLLRSITDVPVEHGTALESAAYALLQAGPEFARWRRQCPLRGRAGVAHADRAVRAIKRPFDHHAEPSPPTQRHLGATS